MATVGATIRFEKLRGDAVCAAVVAVVGTVAYSAAAIVAVRVTSASAAAIDPTFDFGTNAAVGVVATCPSTAAAVTPAEVAAILATVAAATATGFPATLIQPATSLAANVSASASSPTTPTATDSSTAATRVLPSAHVAADQYLTATCPGLVPSGLTGLLQPDRSFPVPDQGLAAPTVHFLHAP